MTNGLIGRKLGMTRVFVEGGTSVPVTVIEAGPCRVLQVRADAVQLGFGARREVRASKAQIGHAKAAGVEAAPAVLREVALAGDAPKAGSMGVPSRRTQAARLPFAPVLLLEMAKQFVARPFPDGR